ncbi:transcriptional regulator, IclR family [Anaerobranca californiensis DSM 14826]|jgi:DNA-binding IclR family transcriptional regulator|uniref:Glycerol operon regulatory protein n=1 Tax=Anaerobranca californiensis DSM 14826 TaxID=1120989 RepID=A0A1M6K7U3_9FIRM|nr:IclR family transcriptional regulator [Anaerobranca californiensis]SHJ54900.1 transcriptional regulator, IclR family [Anaerobranca californiensis DSM 14826]
MNNLVESVVRAILILEELAKNEKGIGITELSKKLSLSKSTVHRLITTLMHMGLVQQDPIFKTYSLGLKVFELGFKVINDLEIKKKANPYIEALAKEINETVHLAIIDNNEIVYIDKVESSRTLKMYSQIGKRAPVHCTALGKVILAYSDEKKVESILMHSKLKRYTNNTITDKDKFKEHLAKVRELGYAIDNIEHEEGVRCVAAPIFDYTNKVIGAISISGPTVRISEDRIKELAELITSTAHKISKSLGYKFN